MAQNKTGAKAAFLQWLKKQPQLPIYPQEYVDAHANLSDGDIVDAPYRLPEILKANENELFLLLFTLPGCSPCEASKKMFANFAASINTPDDFKILVLSGDTLHFSFPEGAYPVAQYLQSKSMLVIEFPTLFVHLPNDVNYKVPFTKFDNFEKLQKVWTDAQKFAEILTTSTY